MRYLPNIPKHWTYALVSAAITLPLGIGGTYFLCSRMIEQTSTQIGDVIDTRVDQKVKDIVGGITEKMEEERKQISPLVDFVRDNRDAIERLLNGHTIDDRAK